MRSTTRIRLGLGLGAMLVVAAVAGVAWATIPGDHGVITGCHKEKNGSLRIIDASQACRPNETRLTWNQAGEPGQPGEQGQPGIPGADGAGVAGFFMTFGTPTPLTVPTANVSTPPLAILTGLPNGPSFATASVNVLNGSGAAVNLICALGEFGGAATFDVPGNPGPGPARAHVVLTGGSNSIGVPFGCHVGGDPANQIPNVTVSGTIEAIALTALHVQP